MNISFQTIYRLLREKHFEDILDISSQLIEKGEKNGTETDIIEGHLILAISYAFQKRYHRSLPVFNKYFEQITQLYSSIWEGKELVHTLMAYNMAPKALDYIDAYIAHNPANHSALFQKAIISLKLEYFEEPKSILTNLYSRFPQNREIIYALAIANQKLRNTNESFGLFEKAYVQGKNEAIYNILKILFKRIGTCEYTSCTDNCCKNVLLKHNNGAPVIDKIDLERLIHNDNRNHCWRQIGETPKRQAIYNCVNFKTDQSCADYSKRPQICIDYPDSPLNKRQACSYQFVLNDDLPKFSSQKVIGLVLEILANAGYKTEVEKLIGHNKHLFEKI